MIILVGGGRGGRGTPVEWQRVFPTRLVFLTAVGPATPESFVVFTGTDTTLHATQSPPSFIVFTATDAALHICTTPLEFTLWPVLLRSSAPEGLMLATQQVLARLQGNLARNKQPPPLTVR